MEIPIFHSYGAISVMFGLFIPIYKEPSFEIHILPYMQFPNKKDRKGYVLCKVWLINKIVWCVH